MTDREKLVELLQGGHNPVWGWYPTSGIMIRLADYLITHGVTFATDTNDGGKWIPVSERLPEPKLNVLVYGVIGDGEQIPTVHSGYTRGIDEGWFTWEDSKLISNVTHWQPMPQPPKGE